MNYYNSIADDYYVNMNLNTEMQLPQARETILDFFERVQKYYPSMRNFYSRENGDFVLEEDKENRQQRWLTLESLRICSSHMNPTTIEEAVDQHISVLQLVPYMLTVSPLDCEALDYMLGFDFNYHGNHDALIAEVFGVGSSFDGLMEIPGAEVLSYEPSMTISLESSCRTQARIMVESRTNAYQVRKKEFAEEQISVYFTVRQYGSLSTETSFEETFKKLGKHSESLLNSYVTDHVLKPLAQAIAAK